MPSREPRESMFSPLRPEGLRKKPSLSVVVPAYREADTIVEALTRLLESLEQLDADCEVIVVSDGNSDGTEAEAARVDSDRLRVLRYERNQGKGYALQHGVAHAKGDLIAFIDADLDIMPSGIAAHFDILQRTGADVVIASKIHPDSNVVYPWFRRFESRVFRGVVELFFRLDVSDTQTGLKLFRREVLDACLPLVHSSGFAFDLELLVLANDAGFRIVEGPVDLNFGFTTTTGMRAVVDVMADVLRTARRRRRERHERTWVSPRPRFKR